MISFSELFPSLWQLDGFVPDPEGLRDVLIAAGPHWHTEDEPTRRRSVAFVPDSLASNQLFEEWCTSVSDACSRFSSHWAMPLVPLGTDPTRVLLTRLSDGKGFSSRWDHDPDEARAQLIAVMFLDAPFSGGLYVFDRLGISVAPAPGRLLIHPAMFMFSTSDMTPIGADLHQLSVTFARPNDLVSDS